ncbi:MAG TPA: class I SAM-dependent methyltransferase [Anaerolineales bacterium]|nr:class I SAM-dependent methyltransferase [Anaerolineales bacterium]
MAEVNYESMWWGYIYDQMMKEDLSDQLADRLRFYRSNLRQVAGPILECGCGTGLIFLPLLADGLDLYGFDISQAMLNTLKRKVEAQRFKDVNRRISVQDLESFHYGQVFDAIIIPSNTFSMLTTQEAQINALKNMHAHLAPKGKLLLDIQLIGMRDLVEGEIETTGRWHTWTHPETGRTIRQRVDGRVDFNRQLVLDRCFIEYEDQREEFPMNARWIFKEEFQLLLRLGGFERWEAFSTPEREPLEISQEGMHSYWIIHKK